MIATNVISNQDTNILCVSTKSQSMEQNEINYEDHKFGYKYDCKKCGLESENVNKLKYMDSFIIPIDQAQRLTQKRSIPPTSFSGTRISQTATNFVNYA